MTRKKPLNVFPIKNLEDANRALKDIACFQRELSVIEAGMNEEIDRIKEAAKARAQDMEERLQGLENGIEAFCEYKKCDLFQKSRSVHLNFGTIGFRRSTSLKPAVKNTWATVLGALKDKGFMSAVRLKESVNKDVLGEWSEERLGEVNVRRVSTDQYWYEVNAEALEPEVR